jgi:dTDP-4-dehydrorhamnose 3,5-epimerase
VKFFKSKIQGAYIIELEKFEDERGFFARSFCKEEFNKIGLQIDIVQCNISKNLKAGTLRGMHYQKTPYTEAKIITGFFISPPCGTWFSDFRR